MGQQILFYMSDGDEDAFISYLRLTGDVRIVPQTSAGVMTEEFRTFRELVGRGLGEACHLWNASISPPPILKHYPNRGYYWLDFMQSEVVNVTRSELTARRLSMGRLHVEGTALDQTGSLRPKGLEFGSWVSELFKWIRDNSQGRASGALVLPGARELIDSGVEPVGHRFFSRGKTSSHADDSTN
jgi:hypothetical protein